LQRRILFTRKRLPTSNPQLLSTLAAYNIIKEYLRRLYRYGTAFFIFNPLNPPFGGLINLPEIIFSPPFGGLGG
jgi:hypothetical protein